LERGRRLAGLAGGARAAGPQGRRRGRGRGAARVVARSDPLHRLGTMAATPFDFSGRVALVTGCGSPEGIGLAGARLLARLGARVAITSTTADRIESRAAELRADG